MASGGLEWFLPSKDDRVHCMFHPFSSNYKLYIATIHFFKAIFLTFIGFHFSIQCKCAYVKGLLLLLVLLTAQQQIYTVKLIQLLLITTLQGIVFLHLEGVAYLYSVYIK